MPRAPRTHVRGNYLPGRAGHVREIYSSPFSSTFQGQYSGYLKTTIWYREGPPIPGTPYNALPTTARVELEIILYYPPIQIGHEWFLGRSTRMKRRLTYRVVPAARGWGRGLHETLRTACRHPEDPAAEDLSDMMDAIEASIDTTILMTSWVDDPVFDIHNEMSYYSYVF